MAWYLIHSDSHALLASDSPLVRAQERGIVGEAVDMLASIRALHDARAAELARASTQAAAAGRIAGEEDGRAAFAEALAALVAQGEADRERREEEIATLALAALRQMVGTMADGDLMGGVARRAVEAVGTRGPVVVEVAPAMVPPVEQALEALAVPVDVTLRADPALADDQCRLTAADGRIIADIPVQLEAFERRWEVAHAG